jgi:hypothetical protein
MITVKMAISSRDSASFLCSVQKVAETIYHTLTFYNNVSDETLNTLVGLCAGSGALLQIERKQTLKLIKRLSASQTLSPILDDEAWAAEVGGSLVGEVEGQRSYRTPWAEPNFGIKFRYRRSAEETVSRGAQDPQYPISPHDGALYGELLEWNASARSLHFTTCAIDSSPCPVAVSKLPPLLTPPSISASEQISHLPSANECPPRPSLITPPASPTPGVFTKVCDGILNNPNTLLPRSLTVKPKASSPGLLSILFSQDDRRTLNRRAQRGGSKGAGLNQPKPEKRSKEQQCDVKIVGGVGRHILEVCGKEGDDEDSDTMGSFEIKQKQAQQLQRLRNKAPAPPAGCHKTGKSSFPARYTYLLLTIIITEHKTNKPQPRPVKLGGAVRGARAAFRERESTRRRVPDRGMETKVA